MPIRILILGLLYSLGGALALIEMLSDSGPGQSVLNLGFLLLPIGVGLLLAKRWALWWAKAALYFALAVIVFALIMGTLDPSTASATINGTRYSGSEAVPYVWMTGLGFGALFYGMLRLLKSEVAKAYFASKGSDLDPTTRS